MPMNIVARAALSRRRVLSVFAVALTVPALPALAAKDSAKDSAAKIFLDSIYQHYVGSSAEGAKGVLLASTKTVRGYFTVGLASLIIDDRTGSARRGEPPALDGDPFVGRQDWDISNLTIEVKETGAVKAIGTVTFMDSGKPQKVVLELLRSGNDWRIADIEWESGSLRGLFRRKATHDAETAPR